MVRTYKRVGGRLHAKACNSEQLEAAITHVRNGKSLRKVSTETGVPRRTLRNHMSGHRGGHGSNGGRPPALLPQEQLSIAQHAAVLSDERQNKTKN